MMNIKTTFLSCFCFLTAFNVNAEWVMEKNAALDLCNEYLAYLNRKPVDYYFQGMKPDPEFKDLVFPKMTQVDFEDYKHVLKKHLSKYKSPSNPTWEETVKHLEEGKAKFYVYNADVNHDLKKERVFSLSAHSLRSKIRGYSGFIMDENNDLLDMGNNPVYSRLNAFTGHPFYYRGRFYTASFRDSYVGLSEPSLPWKREVGINSGSAICIYRTKVFLDKGVKK